MKTRCEFQCLSVKKTVGYDPGAMESVPQYEVELKPSKDSPDNNVFFIPTSAAVSLGTLRLEHLRREVFEAGKSYFFDIEEVDASTDKKTITLRVPIQLAKDRPVYRVLELYKPTDVQLMRMETKFESNPTLAISQLISDVTRIVLPVIEKMNISQLEEWTEAKDFLLGFRKI
jgi:hypothetical protein